MPRVAILAYGSLAWSAGPELEAAERRENVETPFAVEYARSSRSRGWAPTLVPVPQAYGQPVRGCLLILPEDVDVVDARNRLYRREVHREGDPSVVYDPNHVRDIVINELQAANFKPPLDGVSTVLSTAPTPNIDVITDPDADDLSRGLALARYAQASVTERTFTSEQDGIIYLRNNLDAGIKTRLTDAYVEALLHITGASNLDEARLKTALDNRLKSAPPVAHPAGSNAVPLDAGSAVAMPPGWSAVKLVTPPAPAANDKITMSDDLAVKDWSEARSTIGRLDTTIAGLRQYGFTLTTGFLTASALVTEVGSSGASTAARAAVVSSLMLLILVLYGVDRYYCVLQSGAVERAMNLEHTSSDALSITTYVSRNSIVSVAGWMALVLYMGLLLGALALGLGILPTPSLTFLVGASWVEGLAFAAAWAVLAVSAGWWLELVAEHQRTRREANSDDTYSRRLGLLLLLDFVLPVLGLGVALTDLGRLTTDLPWSVWTLVAIVVLVALAGLVYAWKQAQAQTKVACRPSYPYYWCWVLLVAALGMGVGTGLAAAAAMGLPHAVLYHVVMVLWVCLTLMISYFLYTAWTTGTEFSKPRK